eukprot:4638127-Amphidinium_carterae.1
MWKCLRAFLHSHAAGGMRRPQPYKFALYNLPHCILDELEPFLLEHLSLLGGWGTKAGFGKRRDESGSRVISVVNRYRRSLRFAGGVANKQATDPTVRTLLRLCVRAVPRGNSGGNSQ